MVETSNNLIAALLVVAIVISGMGMLSILGSDGGPLEGYVSGGVGTANVTVTGEVGIIMLRNTTNFGSDSLGAQARAITTDVDNAVFDDGSEGNGTDYGTCSDAEASCAFPWVVENAGNQNLTIGINMTAEASSWISPGAGMYLKGQSNETEACNEFTGLYAKDAAWIPLNVSSTTNNVCTNLGYDDDEGDEVRIHFQILLPSDTPPTTYGRILSVTAVAS